MLWCDSLVPPMHLPRCRLALSSRCGSRSLLRPPLASSPLHNYRRAPFSQCHPFAFPRSLSLEPVTGTKTPWPEDEDILPSPSAYYFEAGYALFAKRPSRAFPPPFQPRPSALSSDSPTAYDQSQDNRQVYDGHIIRGITNGDDAVLVNENLIAANDGVGAWAHKENGHAALWSRLILHFWALEAEKDKYGGSATPDLKAYLQRAFEETKKATSKPNEWFGTTTASGALMHSDDSKPPKPVLYVTQLGDSQILVIRPRDSSVIFKTTEQWHWFDCPRQLGTNSPDTPDENGVMDRIEIEEDDVVLAMSDGVIDNLWEHEIVTNVVENIKKAEKKFSSNEYAEGMRFVATELMKAARTIAEDPFAESPFMERAVEEGLPTEGGKLDDISVVAAICRRRQSTKG